MKTSFLVPVIGDGFPMTIKFQGNNREEFVEWYKEHQSEMDEMLSKKGAIVFKGLDLKDMSDFEFVTGAITQKFISYVDGFSPRVKLSKNVYTSTEYDADFYITLHNELSFSNKWPSRIFFFCVTPASEGGETLIVDGREIIKAMRQELLDEFIDKGVTYVRNLHDGGGPGPSWQQTYESESKETVEEYCKEGNIEFEWKTDGGLKIIQKKDALLQHPANGELVWFNQVDQFHPCHLDKEIYETLMDLYGNDEASLPMYGSFGDSSPIEEDKIHEVRSTIDKITCQVKWEEGDLLMLDNVLVAHGRMPFKGDRKILVSMSE